LSLMKFTFTSLKRLLMLAEKIVIIFFISANCHGGGNFIDLVSKYQVCHSLARGSNWRVVRAGVWAAARWR
jgi:hypothetical protein